MTERRDFDSLTPEFKLHIDGREVPPAVKADVTTVAVLNDVEAAGMFSFTLLCWDGAKMEVKWIDEAMFNVGNRVEIEMGYRDHLRSVFQGEITGLEPEFPSDAPPALTVRGYDRRHRMMRKRKTRTFLNMKDSDIANEIAGDWGLTPRTEDSQVTFEYVLQNNQTDFIFLQQRALRIGYEVVVTDTTFYFRPRQNGGDAVLTLNREIELLDFRARLSTAGQVEEMCVQGWDPQKKEEILARSSPGDVQPMSGDSSGPAATGRAFEGTGSLMVDQPVGSQAEAEHIVRGRFKEMALGYVEGHGICIGRQ